MTSPPYHGPSGIWQFVAGDGTIGSVGGTSGSVIGTLGFQDITVNNLEGGLVAFDATFNRGGDIIRLPGQAADWVISQYGSQAVFARPYSVASNYTMVTVPVGKTGTTISFDDGARTLKHDVESDEAKLGSQVIAQSETAPITAPAEKPVPPASEHESAEFTLLLEGATTIVGGNAFVLGSEYEENVIITAGNVRLDGSFNKGEDSIYLVANAEDFSAVLVGSNLLLKSDTMEVWIPVGRSGTDLFFVDYKPPPEYPDMEFPPFGPPLRDDTDKRTLAVDVVTEIIRIGDQLIGHIPVTLTEFA